MEEDSTYKEQLTLFIESTDEKQKELEEIMRIVSVLPRRQRFLDVGAGCGDLSGPISELFEETTAVEPNEEQAQILAEHFGRFIIFNDVFDNVDLGRERFDLILCSHVLYYVPENQWLDYIERMHRHLDISGRIVIVLQSPLGEVSDFFNHFAKYDVNVLALWGELTELYGEDSVEVKYVRATTKTKTLADMTSIGLFLLLDARSGKGRLR